VKVAPDHGACKWVWRGRVSVIGHGWERRRPRLHRGMVRVKIPAESPPGSERVRKLRPILYLLMPALGVALVIGAVVMADTLPVRLILVVVGLLLTGAGAFRLADPVLPDDRRYMALRAEAEHFIALVRQLNAVSLALDEGGGGVPRFALEEVRMEMQRSLDRMLEFAGRSRDDTDPAAAGSAGVDVAGSDV
jgi:hypothetical protein